jgi:aspartate aminotransferase
MRINEPVAEMPGSGIREIMNRALGRPGVIRLEIGDPNFPTPRHIVEAAHAAALSGATGYTQTAGIPPLREALAEKVRARNHFTVHPDQVVVAHGGVNAIFASLLTLTRPGDEILVPEPAWPVYRMMLRVLNLVPVTYALAADSGFLPAPDELERLLTPRTGVLLLNSPSNPLGAVIGRTRMTELLEFAARHDLWTVSDEAYDEITFGDTFVSAASIAPDHVVSCYSFSKTYAMTGWRIGYAVAPPEIAPTLAKCQEPLLTCVSTPTQHAALAALTGSQDVVREMREAYRSRRDLALSVLERSALRAFRPEGAFFLWIDVRSTGLPSRDLALRLLDEHAVALAFGTTFGEVGEGFVRVSLASSEEALTEGLTRLVDFAGSLVARG